MLRETGASDVAEIQGLYGAFSFSEKLLQKIWLQGAFDRAGAVTIDGRRVRIVHPGKWNRLGGPDFKGARIRFDEGSERFGDIELHLHAEDWNAHGHAADPAYAHVILHVVLFWPAGGCTTRGGGGACIPILPLLPLLHHDLEEYAADEAVEALSGRPTSAWLGELAELDGPGLRSLLDQHAEIRWRQKLRFAAIRIERLGWDAACHQTALEVLGYRFNRAPMARLAARWPLATWAGGEVTPEGALLAEAGHWSVQGVRPANHPRTRLAQYTVWCRSRRTWPVDLLEWAQGLSASGESTPEARRAGRFGDARDALARGVCASVVGGSRLDTLICDAFLPLAAAHTGLPTLSTVWFQWFCGDLPPLVLAGLKHLALTDGRTQPACHGLAQGLLGWLIEREVQRRLPCHPAGGREA